MAEKKMSNRRLVGMLVGITVGMFGFGFALVPLYDVFCDITGLRLTEGGTGRVALEDVEYAQGDQEERWVTLQFDSTVDRGLPWEFKPSVKSMQVKVGALSSAFYTAANTSQVGIVGHAVPSVAPTKAQLHFAKTECFCFTQQQLAAGESREMPVRFIISPDLPEDVKIMTLSYRFYKNEEATAELAANN
jgi:cytochrome c oxidase assembly protein subunit 11